MTNVDFITLGQDAVGSIQAGTNQQDRLDEITERLLTDEFYIPTNEPIPRRCIDGRSPAEGFNDAAPNAAGGSETLLIADVLTGQRFRTGGSTADDFAHLLDFIAGAGLKSGGHTDDHATGDASGCGANDKLPAIMQFIADDADVIRAAAGAIGVSVADDAHATVVTKAQQLAAEGRYASGAAMLQVLREKGGTIDALSGSHNEVVAVINTKPHTTLDRNKLRQALGEHHQAFNVDAWAFGVAAELLAEDQPADTLQLAMVYYDLATACVLGGPDLRVVVRG